MCVGPFCRLRYGDRNWRPGAGIQKARSGNVFWVAPDEDAVDGDLPINEHPNCQYGMSGRLGGCALMMNDSTDAACAADVVRCLYLARVAERLGHAEAARRWLKKTEQWLGMFVPRQPPTGAVVNSQGREPLEQEP